LHLQKHKILGTAKVLLSSLKSRTSEREASAIVKVLVEEISGYPYPSLIADPETTFSHKQFLRWQEVTNLILQGTPLQYALEKAWFIDLELKVGPGALVPRPETEELADLAHQFGTELKRLPKRLSKTSLSIPLRILDIGTGTGCIPIYLARKFPQASIQAVDLSEAALAIANENIQSYNVQVQALKMDILQTTPSSFVDLDLVISNPPYIPIKERAEMEEGVKGFEPAMALFVPDNDPLRFYRKIIKTGFAWLAPWGQMLFETHENYAQDVKSCMEKAGFRNVNLLLDLQGKERIVYGTAPAK